MVDETAVIVGTGFTVSGKSATPKHEPLLTATVYTVVAVGETTICDPVVLVGSQVKFGALELAVIILGTPEQAMDGVLETLTGIGTTVMVVTELVIPHPFCPFTV